MRDRDSIRRSRGGALTASTAPAAAGDATAAAVSGWRSWPESFRHMEATWASAAVRARGRQCGSGCPARDSEVALSQAGAESQAGCPGAALEAVQLVGQVLDP